MFDTPSRSILGHYEGGKLHGAALSFNEGAGGSEWCLGTYSNDKFVFGNVYPSGEFTTVFGLHGFGGRIKSRINQEGGALPMMVAEDEGVEQDVEVTNDLGVLRALIENLRLVGFNQKEVWRMLTIIAPIAVDSWKGRSESWFHKGAMTFAGVNSLYVNDWISPVLDNWSEQTGGLSQQIVAENGPHIICDAALSDRFQPEKSWIEADSKFCELICTVAFYFECNQEFETTHTDGNLPDGTFCLILNVDQASVAAVHKKWSQRIGATSTIPRSDELISKLYGSFTMGGPNEECKILIQSIYESFLDIGIAGRSAAQIFTDAAYTEESLKLFFGENAGAKIMHDFSFAVFQRSTWTRALASIFTEAPPAKLVDVRLGKTIQNHGFFSQFMLRRYSELILMKNEGEADDFQIHELLLRLSDPRLLSRICDYGDDWIQGGLLSKSKNRKILAVSAQDVKSISSDIFMLPTNVALMRLLLHSRCDVVCSAILLLRFEQILAEETMVKNSCRRLKRTSKPSINAIFDSAAKKVEAIQGFQSNMAGKIESLPKIRRMAMFMEEVFSFAQHTWASK